MNEAAFKALISGERRGAPPAILRGGLSVASLGYGLAVRLRNAAFDAGLKRACRAGTPVVSVGNITAGGTGKTPFVAWLVRWLQARGRRPAILSRGYRTLDGAANDEKLVLDRLCPGVPHVQNRDRVAGASTAIEQQGADVLVLDDGFQHRRLARDLDIVLIDALNPWGYGRLLPRGLLREPLPGLRRAGLIAITRADQATPETLARIRDGIARTGAVAPVIEVAYPPESLVNSAGRAEACESLLGCRALAFCGIGNPAGFERLLKSMEIDVAELRAFPDHHHYEPAELHELAERAAALDAATILTTEKDLVKIPRDALGGRPLWAVRIGTRIRCGEEEVERRLAALLTQ